jgi:hypothetical protein
VEVSALPGGFELKICRMPFRRNQDVIHVREGSGGDGQIISVVDGWNDPQKISSNDPGREAALFVAGRYPETFLAMPELDLPLASQAAAEQVDREFLIRYPAHVASVGVFAFCSRQRTVLVSVGTIHVWAWTGTAWQKPAGVGDYFLPEPPYQSGSRTFWGRGELKTDPFYALKADTAVLSADTPFLVATDGLDDVVAPGEINGVCAAAGGRPGPFFEALAGRAASPGKQRDDITLLMRGRP